MIQSQLSLYRYCCGSFCYFLLLFGLVMNTASPFLTITLQQQQRQCGVTNNYLPNDKSTKGFLVLYTAFQYQPLPERRTRFVLASQTVQSASNNKDTNKNNNSKKIDDKRKENRAINDNNNNTRNKKPKKKTYVTLGELQQEVLRSQNDIIGSAKSKQNSKGSKRTRKKVEQPKQQYVYAAHKRHQAELQQKQRLNGSKISKTNNSGVVEGNDSSSDRQIGNTGIATSSISCMDVAKSLGFIPSLQHMDASLATINGYPKVVGRLLVADDTTSKKLKNDSSNNCDAPASSYAYIIDKPAGWSILGSGTSTSSSKSDNKALSKEKNGDLTTTTTTSSTTIPKLNSLCQTLDSNGDDKYSDKYIDPANVVKKRNQKPTKRIKVVDEDGSVDVLEYSEDDVIALLTPEELEEYMSTQQEQQRSIGVPITESTNTTRNSIDGSNDNESTNTTSAKTNPVFAQPINDPSIDPQTAANLMRIMARMSKDNTSNDDSSAQGDDIAAFALTRRPSIVSWLKQEMQQEFKRTNTTNNNFPGGTYWTPIIGATGVDDSGYVVICPKHAVSNVICDSAEYVAVVGNGGYLAPKAPSSLSSSLLDVQMVVQSKLVKNRSNDPIQTVKLTVSSIGKVTNDLSSNIPAVATTNTKSTCADVVQYCQEQYSDGIRGDPNGNPFDRRAQRRLIHCNSISIRRRRFYPQQQQHQRDTLDTSNDTSDGPISLSSSDLPDDIAVLAERMPTSKKFIHKGSFIGRSFIRQSSSTINTRNNIDGSLQKTATTAYREINGAGDGYPGWIVDRYDKWLLVQHDPQHPKGPLPSIHDGNTLGVYYLQTLPDRSLMGSSVGANNKHKAKGTKVSSNVVEDQQFQRPTLMEGKAAPDLFPILENGITYMVSLNQDLSTGIFLDQRYHRLWLAQNCCPETRVLNCFAHTGAYSIAAASAGAATVSIDLSQKWLQRLPQHFAANNIPFDERHDCIYGDCFQWLSKLVKRGEKYDVVILDPPSTSVNKKRRWSIVNDMDELISLAAKLVKTNGYLWTTTNSASIDPIKFTKLCSKGFQKETTLSSTTNTSSTSSCVTFKLERMQPMPLDFPSIGPQPVKNLVWKIL